MFWNFLAKVPYYVISFLIVLVAVGVATSPNDAWTLGEILVFCGFVALVSTGMILRKFPEPPGRLPFYEQVLGSRLAAWVPLLWLAVLFLLSILEPGLAMRVQGSQPVLIYLALPPFIFLAAQYIYVHRTARKYDATML